MNKQQYLSELKRELEKRKIDGIEDVLSEYGQHFDLKITDGYSEEETANRLEKPSVIAEQFMTAGGFPSSGKGKNLLAGIGLGFLDVFVVLFFIPLWCWVTVIGVFSLAALILCVSLTGGINPYGLIPEMPYFGAALFGVSFFGLSVLSAVGTVYSCLYVGYLKRSYLRWRRKTMNPQSGTGLPARLNLTAKTGRRLRAAAIAALTVFGLALVAGMFSMFAYTGFKPFWHELRWFV